MVKRLADVILYLDSEDDLPSDNVGGSGIDATIGRLAITKDSNKLWFDDGSFWTDVIITGSLGIGDGPLILRINSLAAPNANWSNNSKKITSVLNPTDAQDAATKDYTDSSLSALAGSLTTSLQGYANGVGAAAQGYTDSQVAGLATEPYVDDAVAGVGGGGSGAAFSLVYTEDGEVVLLEDGTLATVRL